MAGNANQADGDGDGKGDLCDNCPAVSNASQADADATIPLRTKTGSTTLPSQNERTVASSWLLG